MFGLCTTPAQHLPQSKVNATFTATKVSNLHQNAHLVETKDYIKQCHRGLKSEAPRRAGAGRQINRLQRQRVAATHTRVSHCCRCTHSATGKQRPMKYGPQVASHHLPADTRDCRDRRIIYMPCRTSYSFGAVTDAWAGAQGEPGHESGGV